MMRTVICNVFITIIYYSQYVTTVNFIYRYAGVVHDRPLSARKYFVILAILISILATFFACDYFITLPTEDTELVMTAEYIEIFGGPNATNKEELRTCIRGDLVLVDIMS
jgi:hypothetical protein